MSKTELRVRRYKTAPKWSSLKPFINHNVPRGFASKGFTTDDATLKKFRDWGFCGYDKDSQLKFLLGKGNYQSKGLRRVLIVTASCLSVGNRTSARTKDIFEEKMHFIRSDDKGYLWVKYGEVILPVPEDLSNGKILKLKDGKLPENKWIKNKYGCIGLRESICKNILEQIMSAHRKRSPSPKKGDGLDVAPPPKTLETKPTSTEKNNETKISSPKPVPISRRNVEFSPSLYTDDQEYRDFVKSETKRIGFKFPPPLPLKSRYTITDNAAIEAAIFAGFEMGLMRGNRVASLNLSPEQEHVVKAGGGFTISKKEVAGNLVTTAHDEVTGEVRVINTSRKVGNRWVNNLAVGTSMALHSILPQKQAYVWDGARVNRLSLGQMKDQRSKVIVPGILEYSERRLEETRKEIKKKLDSGNIKILFVAMDGQWNSRRRRGHRARHNVVSFIVYLSDGSRYFVVQAFSTRGEVFLDLIEKMKKENEQSKARQKKMKVSKVECLEKIAVQKGLLELFEIDILSPLICTDACCKAIRAIKYFYAHLVYEETDGAVLVQYNLDKFHVFPKRKLRLADLVGAFEFTIGGVKVGKIFEECGGVKALGSFYIDCIKRSEDIEDTGERIRSCTEKWENGIKMVDFLKDSLGRKWRNEFVGSGLLAHVRMSMAETFEDFNSTKIRTTDVEVYHSRYSKKDNKAQPIGFDSFRMIQGVNRMHHGMTFGLDDLKEVTREDEIPDGSGRKLPRETFTHENRLELFKTLNRNIVDTIVYGISVDMTREELLRLTRKRMEANRTGLKRKREEGKDNFVRSLQPARKKRKRDHPNYE